MRAHRQALLPVHSRAYGWLKTQFKRHDLCWEMWGGNRVKVRGVVVKMNEEKTESDKEIEFYRTRIVCV